MGIFINPKKAIYNKIYNKTTTRGCMLILIQIPFLLIIIFLILK